MLGNSLAHRSEHTFGEVLSSLAGRSSYTGVCVNRALWTGASGVIVHRPARRCPEKPVGKRHFDWTSSPHDLVSAGLYNLFIAGERLAHHNPWRVRARRLLTVICGGDDRLSYHYYTEYSCQIKYPHAPGRITVTRRHPGTAGMFSSDYIISRQYSYKLFFTSPPRLSSTPGR